MEFTIKGRREKESINEIRSKPKPADVTAKTALMSPSVCTSVQNRRRPPACQSESCHLRPNERSRKSGTDCGTSRPGNPTPRQNRAVSPAANTAISTARTKPYAPAPFGCVRRKRRNRSPNNRGGGTPSPYVRTCPVLIKESYLWHTEGGARPRSAIRRTCGRVRASVGTTSPTAANGTPVLGNFQSARLFWRTRTHSTARFASALPAAKGRTNTPSSSFWKARFINLFAGKSPPLPFIRRYTIPVVNAA